MYTMSVRLHFPPSQQVLADISWGWPSHIVRQFIVDAYVKGARTCGSAEHAELEGSTSVFAKRRYLPPCHN
jgi:hypothetical protein